MPVRFVRFVELSEMTQYLVHDCGILDTGNDLDRATALITRFEIELEHAFETPREFET